MAHDGLDYGLSDGFSAAVAPTERATDIVTLIASIIRRGGGEDVQLRAEQIEEDYVSMFYDTHEFAHLNPPGAPLWIEFAMTPAMKQKYTVDERFNHIANKNMNFWHIDLNRPEDIEEYADVIRDETL